MNISNQDLETYADEMLDAMSKQFESIETFKKNFEQNKSIISCEAINYCLEKFLHAEFDYSTPGVRGLGRMTDFYPRLAGYYRKPLSNMEAEKMRELDSHITRLLMKSYLFLLLISNNKMEPTDTINAELFYKRWLPQVYTFNLNNFGETTINLLFAVIKKDFENIQNFFKQNGMKTGFFGINKETRILDGYIMAGTVMSMVASKKTKV